MKKFFLLAVIIGIFDCSGGMEYSKTFAGPPAIPLGPDLIEIKKNAPDGSNGQVLKMVGGEWAPASDSTGVGGDQLVDIVATSPLLVNTTTNVDDALPGSDADITFSMPAATNSTPGHMTAAQVTALEAVDTEAELEALLDLQDLQGAVTDGQVPDTITVSNYLPLAGGTLTDELVVDENGIEFQETDTISDCSGFAATGGGIFYDDSDGKFKKCEDNVLSDLDTAAGSVDTTGTVNADEIAVFNDSDTLKALTEAEFKTAYNMEAGIDFLAPNGDGSGLSGVVTSESDPNALLTAGTDNVKDTHVDWGTGANQVSGVDMPLDVTNFDNNLSGSDTTVQAALETLDEVAGGSGAPTTAHYWTDQAEAGLSAEVVVNSAASLATAAALGDYASTILGATIDDEAGFKAAVNLEAGTDFYSVSGADAAFEAINSNDFDPDRLAGDTTDDNLIDQDIVEGLATSGVATPGFTAYDSDLLGADKTAGDMYWNGITLTDGAEDTDWYLRIMQGGALTQVLTFDESDDQFETTKGFEAATLTEGGNAVYNSSETPGGILGGTWANPTIDADSILFSHLDDDGNYGPFTGTWEWNSPFEFYSTTSGDQTIAAAQLGLKTDEDLIVTHGGANGEVQDEVGISLLQHISFSMDPSYMYDQESTYRSVPLMVIGDDFPHGFTITEWSVAYVGGDPTTELDADLICDTTPDYNTAAGATVMDVLDTTAGSSNADTGFDSATCANGSTLYIHFGADPTDANVVVTFNLWGYTEED